MADLLVLEWMRGLSAFQFGIFTKLFMH